MILPMPDTDDPPEISRLEEGDDVRVYYRSHRSGNEVDRKGTIAGTTQPNEETLYWVHTDQKSRIKHQFLVLAEAELESGDDAVAAYSATVSADPPNDGDPPMPGGHYVLKFTASRTSLLGVVDRVMRDGWNINVQGNGRTVSGGSSA